MAGAEDLGERPEAGRQAEAELGLEGVEFLVRRAGDLLARVDVRLEAVEDLLPGFEGGPVDGPFGPGFRRRLGLPGLRADLDVALAELLGDELVGGLRGGLGRRERLLLRLPPGADLAVADLEAGLDRLDLPELRGRSLDQLESAAGGRHRHVGDDEVVPVELSRRRGEGFQLLGLLGRLGDPHHRDRLAGRVHLGPEQVAVVRAPVLRGSEQAAGVTRRPIIVGIRRRQRKTTERKDPRHDQESAARNPLGLVRSIFGLSGHIEPLRDAMPDGGKCLSHK